MPSEYVDYEMTSQIFSPDQLTLAPFVAGTLREIILSLEFAKFPKSSRRKIEHLSFLIHLQIRFDNFPLIYKLHRDILEDINSGNAKWNDTDFFLKAEENILGVLNRHQPAQEDVSSLRDLEHLTEEDNDISKEELVGEEAPPGEVQDLKDEDTPQQEDLQHLETEDMLDMDRVEEVLADLEDPEDIEDVESETEDIPRVYEECSICQERVEIVSKRSMSSHIKLKHSTKFYCPYCNASKCSGVLMLRHIEREHVGAAPRPVLCTTCGDVSTGFNQYLQHIKIHSVVTCQVCSKQFSDTARYKRHYAVCHAVGRDEVCPYCGKKYKHLKSHIYARTLSGRPTSAPCANSARTFLAAWQTTSDGFIVSLKFVKFATRPSKISSDICAAKSVLSKRSRSGGSTTVLSVRKSLHKSFIWNDISTAFILKLGLTSVLSVRTRRQTTSISTFT